MKLIHCLISASVVLGISLMPPVQAEVKENPKVDQLAHEGYWPDAFDDVKGLLKKPAPALDLTDWHGKAVTAADMKSKIVLIDFWFTGAPGCIEQIPHLNAIAKKYADKGVIAFGACCWNSETMAATATKHNMEYPTGRLTTKALEGWRIEILPTYVVIDREGKVRALLKPDYIEKVLDELLVEQPPQK